MQIPDRTLALIAVLALAIAAALGASPARAAAQTLVGESFASAEHIEGFLYDGVCDADGPSTFTYGSFGSAEGPVPGQYSQYGSVTLASPSGPVSAYSAEFTIHTAEGEVTGTEALAEPGSGSCTPGSSDFVAEVPATYEVGSPFAETGPASVSLYGSFGFGTLAATFGPPPASGPGSRQDCMDGRWADYGFRNQGQCIKAVDDKSGRP